jgi:hypothetical protein
MVATIKQIQESITPNSGISGIVIQLPDVNAKIAELAYYKALSRGFEPGHELDDWLSAEQEFSF